MAKRIPEEVINEIRRQVNIVDVIGQYVELQKRGKNYFGLCPFHDENTPSFTVQAEEQFFKCFSCGRGGNVYTFLMALENDTFPEAVQKVAEFGNISVDFDFQQLETDQRTQYDTRQQFVLQIHEEVATLYHYLLTSTKAGQEALAYLTQRGITETAIETYRIGLSPEDSNFVYQHLLNKNYTVEAIRDSGIFVESHKSMRDRFCERIVFPLIDIHQQVIGFSGRIYKETTHSKEQAKYLNSPETILFKKSQFLFNLNIAKEETRQTKEMILYEGFMDVIKSFEAGVKNGVASLGTSLTTQHIQLLERYTKHLVIAYDGDKPGVEAAKRALEHMTQIAPNQEIQIIHFPSGMDPDDFVTQYGKERYQRFLQEQRMTPIRFYRNYYRQKYSLATDEGKLNYIQHMLDQIRTYRSPIEREMYIAEVAEDTDVSKDTLLNQLKEEKSPHKPLVNAKSDHYTTQEPLSIPSIQKRKYSKLESAEIQLLYRLIHNPEAWTMLAVRVPEFTFHTTAMETLYLLLQDYHNQIEDSELRVDDFFVTLKGEIERNLLTDVVSLELPSGCSDKEMDDLIDTISRQANLQMEIKRLSAEIQQARIVNDQSTINALNSQRIQILQQLKR